MEKDNNLSQVKLATALKYEPFKDEAPIVTATGQGEIAEEIINVAKEHDIPIYKDPPLAQTLNQLEVGAIIPEELYQTIAELLIFIYKTDYEYGKNTIYESILEGG